MKSSPGCEPPRVVGRLDVEQGNGWVPDKPFHSDHLTSASSADKS